MSNKELQYFLNIFGNRKGIEIKEVFKEFKELQKRMPGLKTDTHMLLVS